MKSTDAFHLPEPGPFETTEASLDLLVAPTLPGRHPCGDCLAMCCWFLPVERGRVETAEDLDAIEAYLAYERVSVWVERSGDYTVGFVTPCRLLDRRTCACTVHDTPAQPRVCRDFEARTCWYRARFEAGRAEEALRLDGHTWADYRRRIEGGVGSASLPDVSPYALARIERSYRDPAVIDLDMPVDSLPPADGMPDLLAFLGNFEGVEVSVRGGAWRLRFVTRRDAAHPPTELELLAHSD